MILLATKPLPLGGFSHTQVQLPARLDAFPSAQTEGLGLHDHFDRTRGSLVIRNGKSLVYLV